MRYYVTEEIEGTLVVIAEAIGRRDLYDGEEIPHSIAEGIGLSRDQLLEVRGGREALWAWERGDDSAYAKLREAWWRREDVEEIDELAAAGNPWARQLADDAYPEPEVRAFLRSDRAVPYRLSLIDAG